MGLTIKGFIVSTMFPRSLKIRHKVRRRSREYVAISDIKFSASCECFPAPVTVIQLLQTWIFGFFCPQQVRRPYFGHPEFNEYFLCLYARLSASVSTRLNQGLFSMGKALLEL